MNKMLTNSIKLTLGLVLGGTLSTSTMAQSGALEARYPELAKLYNAFDVTQAAAFDAIAEINANPATMQARMDLRMELDMVKDMDMHEMMSQGMGHGDSMDMGMDMLGPYGELEVEARVRLNSLVRGEHSADEAAGAYLNAKALPRHAAMVLTHGRMFENAIWDIFADPSTSMAAKRAAVDVAVAAYKADDPRHSVSLTSKSADLYLNHEYANGLKSAFPRISGMLWSNQWLQLASLEAIILGQVDSQFAGEVPTTLERYWNKLGSDAGMTMFPPPTEMPSTPAIAPQLYSQSPQAAVIIDNLNMLEAAIADIIAYPNLAEEQREEDIQWVVLQFTDDESANVDTMNYLLSALRGGIFNQGGPAIGELGQSERNRSREAMGMQHSMIMSGPN
jgi:hypothetical protein